MEKLYISIVIPTYNRADLLKECLISLTLQTYNHFEVLVCDDGSTDNSKEVVDEFKNKLEIKYLWEPNWGGPARPRNIGIKNAKYDWIAFLDSDDSWYPNKLDVCIPYLDNTDLLYHDLSLKGINIPPHLQGINGRKISSEQQRDLLFNGNAIPTSSVIVRKSVLHQVDGFSEDKEIIAVEDYDLWIRLAGNNIRFTHVCKKLGYYYYDGSGISSNIKKQLYKHLQVINRNNSNLSNFESRFIHNNRYILAGVRLLTISKKRESNNLFFKIITNRPTFKHFRQAFGYLLFGLYYKRIKIILRQPLYSGKSIRGK